MNTEHPMKREEILAQLEQGKISRQEALRLLEEAERPPRGTLYCKVSPKGAMSLYGLQRMPVTLYAEQWERLLAFEPEIRKFIQEHHAELKRKER
jgi:hypothetical protein